MTNRPLAAIVVVGILALGVIGIRSSQKSEDAKRAAESSQQTLNIQILTAQRTECFRDIGAKLDHFQWQEMGNLIDAATRRDIIAVQAIGDVLRTLPTIADLGDHGGHIGGDKVAPCPPVPASVR